MTESEHFYKRQYHKYLSEYSSPAITRVAVAGEVVTPEVAAKQRAGHDLKVYKANHREIKICCNGMKDNHEHGDDGGLFARVSVIANYKQPDKEPKVCLGGNVISYCPFCAAPLVILPFKDKRYVAPVINKSQNLPDEEDNDDT